MSTHRIRRASRRASSSVLSVAAAVLLGTGGCGGSGGGGGGGGCTIPGTLSVLAREGNAAPDTAGGVYGFFSTLTPISVAQGGWTAFTANVVSGGSTAALFVAPPNQPVRRVYRQGEGVPAPGDGQIATFERIFVTADGIVVAVVTITGGTTNFGILTARVDGSGDIVERTGAVYHGQALPAASGMPAPGALIALDPDVAVADDGRIFFVGQGATDSGVFAVSRLGTGLVAAAQEGQVAVGFGPGETLGSAWDALATDENGLLLGYSVNVVPSGNTALYANNLSVVSLVAKTGDSVPGVGGRTLLEAYDSGPLLVALNAGVGVFVWKSELTGGHPDDVILLRQVAPSLGALTSMAAGGQTAPGAGAGALLGNLTLLDSEIDSEAATVRAEIVGGNTLEVFYDLPSPGTFLEVWREGENAPGGGAGTFTTAYPSLVPDGQIESDVVGSVGVTAILSDATTGLYWAVRDCGFFLVAGQGDPFPGGGSFGSFGSTSTVATALGVIAFRSGIDGDASTSAILRRR
jgi:hypothetical protein